MKFTFSIFKFKFPIKKKEFVLSKEKNNYQMCDKALLHNKQLKSY